MTYTLLVKDSTGTVIEEKIFQSPEALIAYINSYNIPEHDEKA